LVAGELRGSVFPNHPLGVFSLHFGFDRLQLLAGL
jgi:hypothetical protein